LTPKKKNNYPHSGANALAIIIHWICGNLVRELCLHAGIAELTLQRLKQSFRTAPTWLDR